MKRILALTLCILTLFLCACQPTPEEEPVPNKGDDVMGEKIHTTPVPKTPDPNATDDPASTGNPDVTEATFVIPSLEVPEHWNDEMVFEQHGTKVVIDADIGYENKAYPVYLIKDAEDFDNPIMRNLISLFAKDPKWRPDEPTREELLKMLEELLNGTLITDPETGEETLYIPDDAEEQKTEIIKRLQELDPEVHWEDIKTADDIPQGVSVLTDGIRDYRMEQGNRSMILRAYDFRTVLNSELMLLQKSPELPVPSMKKEDAVKQAEEVLDEIGLSDHLAFSKVCVGARVNKTTGKKEGTGWIVSFTLRVEGVRLLDPMDYYYPGQWISSRDIGDETVDFRPSSNNEFFRMYFEDGELLEVDWSYPQEIISVENPAVELMPFDAIKERIKKRIKYGLSYREGYDCTGEDLLINDVFLTYVKVGRTNYPNEFYYAPAWCFTNKPMWTDTPLLTDALFINAIDGTFIQFSN